MKPSRPVPDRKDHMSIVKILKTHRKEPMVNFFELRHNEDTGEISVVYGGKLKILRNILYEFNRVSLNVEEKEIGIHTMIGP